MQDERSNRFCHDTSLTGLPSNVPFDLAYQSKQLFMDLAYHYKKGELLSIVVSVTQVKQNYSS